MRRKADTPTSTLGLARLSTWRVEAFQKAAESLLEQHDLDVGEVTTVETIHGGESVTDVFMRFRNELIAEIVKEVTDGEVIEGRKLKLSFA